MLTQILQSEIDSLRGQLDLAESRVEKLRALLTECEKELALRTKEQTTQAAAAEAAAATALAAANEAQQAAREALDLAREAKAVAAEQAMAVPLVADADILSEEHIEEPEPVTEEPVRSEEPDHQMEHQEVPETPAQTGKPDREAQPPWYGGESDSESVPKTGVTLPPITNIRDAVSLGDRFLFQRELFDTDGELMNKTIDTLNRMHSLDEAMAYINKRFRWDTESQAYELFVNILKRRY